MVAGDRPTPGGDGDGRPTQGPARRAGKRADQRGGKRAGKRVGKRSGKRADKSESKRADKLASKRAPRKPTGGEDSGAPVSGSRAEAEAKGTRLPASTVPARRAPRTPADLGRGEHLDPELHPPTIGDIDLHLFGEGRHRRLHDLLGAHVRTVDGVEGTSFAVWAPRALSVSVVGGFCGWREGAVPLRRLAASGVFEAFVPGVRAGALYKYAIRAADGALLLKSDPYGRFTQQPPGHASVVVAPSEYAWGDAAWLAARAAADPAREPLSVYEVHLGSWARVAAEGNRSFSYREAALPLADRARTLGFTHVELMPVMEHPFGGSWGYQITGYFAPTSRFGSGDDLRFLIDTLHQAGLGVILDWVPAHFPADPHALARFDGAALYEHPDPRRGRHPDWDTLIPDYGRPQVLNFLLANALYWLREYHADGLRVDAVASMLHLDYSRPEGQWEPNVHGGRENLEAVEFIKRLNTAVREELPDCIMIAEESTTWDGVTRPVDEGGLGFHFKWNLGWMHDTLDYFGTDPLYRPWVHDKLTFAMMYEHSERFLMPLSHDEVVHGKGSLLTKMWGDEACKLANLRTLLAYQFTRPGKKLLFMGTELASEAEWDHDESLHWHLNEHPSRKGLERFLTDLGELYRRTSCLWRGDPGAEGFAWIDCDDKDQSVISYVRRDDESHRVIVLNLTPVPRDGYRIGAPYGGPYVPVLNSDAAEYGGFGHHLPSRFVADGESCHGHGQSLVLTLPPLAALVLAPAHAAPDVTPDREDSRSR